MRRLALACLVPLLSARSPDPERILLYTQAVRYALDSIATSSALHHREEGACVARWTTVYAPNARTFYLLAIGPAEVSGADTASIARLVCPDSQPPIHTHVRLSGNWEPYAPSPVDELSLSLTKAPFGIILIAGTGNALIYGVKP